MEFTCEQGMDPRAPKLVPWLDGRVAPLTEWLPMSARCTSTPNGRTPRPLPRYRKEVVSNVSYDKS